LTIGGFAVAAASICGDLPGALESRATAAERRDEVLALEQLYKSQIAAGDDVIARLVAGEYTLAEAADQLEWNNRNRTGFPLGVAQAHPAATERDQWARYAIAKAHRLLEGDEGRWTAVSARLEAKFRALADASDDSGDSSNQ
jgi:hypothetical protein